MDSVDILAGQTLYGTTKRAAASSASSTNPVSVWVPASGRRIRLAGYSYEVSGQVAATGSATQFEATIGTANFGISVHVFRVLTTMLANGQWAYFKRNFPGGLLLPVGETLTMTLSVAIAAGTCTMHAFGREE